MNQALVIGAGRTNHPESDRSLMCITVSKEWAVGGVRYPSTDIWADMPETPQNGDAIAWDGSHVWWKGQEFRKPEYDSNPSAALH